MKDYIEDETPKHKKKSRKTSKKSNHKHDYQYDRTEVMFEFVNGQWVHIIKKCTICGKEKEDFKIIRKDN